jgi:nicotinamide-nucleotide amidase
MVSDEELYKLAAKVGRVLLASGRRLVTAESCTGGWVGKALTDVPGSSAWFLGGVVSYDNALKQALLGVGQETLAIHGAVSDATAREMAMGALERLGGDVALAVSGIAGPDGGQPGKPVGTVWFGWAWRHGQAVHHRTRLKIIEGDREEVRRRSVITALNGVLEI